MSVVNQHAAVFRVNTAVVAWKQTTALTLNVPAQTASQVNKVNSNLLITIKCSKAIKGFLVFFID